MLPNSWQSQLQRTFNIANAKCRDLCIALRRANISVSEQFLNVTNVCAIFQKMRRKTVAQRMKSCCTSDTRAPESIFKNFLGRSRTQFATAFTLKKIIMRLPSRRKITQVTNEFCRQLYEIIKSL